MCARWFSTICLTRSPIEMMSISMPSCITGRWRTRFSVMIAIASSISTVGVMNSSRRVISSLTGVLRAVRPWSATKRR